MHARSRSPNSTRAPTLPLWTHAHGSFQVTMMPPCSPCPPYMLPPIVVCPHVCHSCAFVTNLAISHSHAHPPLLQPSTQHFTVTRVQHLNAALEEHKEPQRGLQNKWGTNTILLLVKLRCPFMSLRGRCFLVLATCCFLLFGLGIGTIAIAALKPPSLLLLLCGLSLSLCLFLLLLLFTLVLLLSDNCYCHCCCCCCQCCWRRYKYMVASQASYLSRFGMVFGP